MTIDLIEKYSFYVEMLPLLNIPTTEPTEYIQTQLSLIPSLAPTQIILSTYKDLTKPILLQYIISVSIATSILTTCFVIFTGYYCSKLRTQLRLQYLESIASDNSSSSLSSVSISDFDNMSSIVDTIAEKNDEELDTRLFWFEDIYRRKMEYYDEIV